MTEAARSLKNHDRLAIVLIMFYNFLSVGALPSVAAMARPETDPSKPDLSFIRPDLDSTGPDSTPDRPHLDSNRPDSHASAPGSPDRIWQLGGAVAKPGDAKRTPAKLNEPKRTPTSSNEHWRTPTNLNEALRGRLQIPTILTGTGSMIWQAARRYSTLTASPDG